MKYPKVTPYLNLYSIKQLLVARRALNDVIDGALEDARKAVPGESWRLRTAEASFNTGGLGTGSYRCPVRMYDGPSNQAAITQESNIMSSPNSYCSGVPFVISTDTGIHPNTGGYRVFADEAVKTFEGWFKRGKARSRR